MTAIKVEFTLEFIGPKTNALASRIDFIKRTIKVDSLLIYESTVSQDLYRIEKSPLKYFELWLSGQEQTQGRSDISSDSGQGVNLVRKEWFQRFNFKQQLLNILFKKLFLGLKTTMRPKVKGISR